MCSFVPELYHYAPRHSSSFEELGHRFEGLFASSHIRAAKPYSLPEELASHVSLVDKLLRLPRLSSPPAAPPPVPRDSPITPAVAAAARAAAGAAAEVASSAAAAAAAAVQEVQEEAEGAMNVVLPRRRLGLGTSRSTRSDCTLGSANCTTTATINEDEEEEEEEDPFVQCTGAAPACKDATTPAVLRARYCWGDGLMLQGLAPWLLSDVLIFISDYFPPLPPRRFTIHCLHYLPPFCPF